MESLDAALVKGRAWLLPIANFGHREQLLDAVGLSLSGPSPLLVPKRRKADTACPGAFSSKNAAL